MQMPMPVEEIKIKSISEEVKLVYYSPRLDRK